MLQMSLEFLKKIPNPKNLGPVMVYPIIKKQKGNKSLPKIIIALLVVIFLIKKLRGLMIKA